MTILRIFSHAAAFLSDPTHWFIIWGGALLAATVAIGRNEIALLKEKIYSLFGKYVDGREPHDEKPAPRFVRGL